MKNKYQEEIEKLMNEKRYREVGGVIKRAQDEFWAIEYPNKSFDEKVRYWTRSIHQFMRHDGEFGRRDRLASFNKENYEDWKSTEPLIDEILVPALVKLGLNPESILKKLKEK